VSHLDVNSRATVWACIMPVLLASLGCGGGPTDGGGTPQLMFVVQPGGAVAGLAFARQPVVELRDDAGRPVTTATPITVTLVSTSGATLSGSTEIMAGNGTAVFSDLAINLIGSAYQLTGSAPNVEPVMSEAFIVTGPASASTSEVTAPASLLQVGETVTVSLVARDAAGTPLTRGGSSVTFSLADGSSAGTFGPTVDGGDGTYTALFTATIAGTPGLVRATIDGAEVTTAAPSLTVVAFASISAGQQHTCGVTTDGRALCWGSNIHGQRGVIAVGSLPVQVPGTQVWTAIHAGHRNTCGQASDGTTYCWGNNEYSQIGNGTWSVRQNEPAAVSGGLAFARLDVGLGFTTQSVLTDQGFVVCAVTTTGQGYCWGDGRFGQIGNGDVAEQAVPTAVSGGLSFGSIAAGSIHTCGIATDGHPWCWGTNANGQLGLGFTPLSELCDGLLCSTSPQSVSTSRLFDPGTIAVGTDHSCALSGGAAYCWGANRFGALGDGSTTTRTSPVAASGGLSFVALTAGDAMTCGLTPEGATYCWGKKSGPGLPTATLVPTLVGGGHTFQQIDAGASHGCGITAEGAAYCWGSNAAGQLGTGNLVSSFSPVRVRLR
jgi:alpha-tubulin suppressor-like RCC1 family protein